MPLIRSTTILAVRRGSNVVLAGDGQVTMNNTVMKAGARKLRRLGSSQEVIAGFAGATADAFTLFERFEGKLKDHGRNLARASVELAKEWRTDRFLRKLEALLLVADSERTLILSGSGDVIEPDSIGSNGGVAAIGSGGPYALAAARALVENTDLPARAIAERAMKIAADICVFTNEHFSYEEIA